MRIEASVLHGLSPSIGEIRGFLPNKGSGQTRAILHDMVYGFSF
jgi:hypothetical protein